MPPHKNSRYLSCVARKDENGKLYLSEPKPLRYDPTLPGTRTHVVGEKDTMHGIAYHYFKPLPNAEHLFWVIAQFQPTPIFDLTLDLTKGRTLYVPSQRVVEERILGR